jgi:hypothetical protein
MLKVCNRGGVLCAAALLLSGCGGSRGIEVRTVEVPIEVPVACIKKMDIPEEPALVGGTLTGNAQIDVRIVAASALILRGALKEAVALLEGCAELPQ